MTRDNVPTCPRWRVDGRTPGGTPLALVVDAIDRSAAWLAAVADGIDPARLALVTLAPGQPTVADLADLVAAP